MAFHGRSPEEQELAGEEMGFSLGDIWKKVVNFAKTPQGAAISTLFLPAPVAAALAASQAAKAVKSASTPKAPSPAAKGSAGPGGPGPGSGPGPGPAPSESAGWYRKGWMMGAAPPMSDADVVALIKREKDPRKRARMIDNFNRARERRGW